MHPKFGVRDLSSRVRDLFFVFRYVALARLGLIINSDYPAFTLNVARWGKVASLMVLVVI